MFDGMLPAWVRWIVADEAIRRIPPTPAETRYVAAASRARQQEFLAGRAAARVAITQLSCATTGDPEIPVGPGRAPVWPRGIVGSITHCPGLVAAAVTRSCELAGLGIDAEPDEPLPAEVVPLVASESELSELSELGRAGSRLIFTVKEAFYKCWSSAGGGYLEFCEVEVELSSGSFRAHPPDGSVWSGTHRVRDGFVLAACWTPVR